MTVNGPDQRPAKSDSAFSSSRSASRANTPKEGSWLSYYSIHTAERRVGFLWGMSCERSLDNPAGQPVMPSSNLGVWAKICECNSVVEFHLAKVDVVGSNPIARSRFLWKRSSVWQ
jgi:hypothetical protein